MLKITKLINSNNQIRIHHSDKVLDKKTHYDIQFDSFYKGYMDYFVRKKVVQNKEPQYGQLSCTLYIPTEKFNEDPQKWIDLFKKYHKDKYGKYKWYKELVLSE